MPEGTSREISVDMRKKMAHRFIDGAEDDHRSLPAGKGCAGMIHGAEKP